MTSVFNKKTMAAVLSVGVAFGTVGVALPSSVNAQEGAVSVASLRDVTDARANPYDYQDKTIVQDGIDYTRIGAEFVPNFSNGDNPGTTFSIVRAMNDKGEDIKSNLRIDSRSGVVTVTRGIGNTNSDFFYFEVTGTYRDGSVLNDKVFVINSNIVDKVTKEDLIKDAEENKVKEERRNQLWNNYKPGNGVNLNSDVNSWAALSGGVSPVDQINSAINKAQKNWVNGVNSVVNNMIDGYANVLRSMGHTEDHVQHEVQNLKVFFNVV